VHELSMLLSGVPQLFSTHVTQSELAPWEMQLV
jgi:hypothetical protein